jgi:hypothetical protein
LDQGDTDDEDFEVKEEDFDEEDLDFLATGV